MLPCALRLASLPAPKRVQLLQAVDVANISRRRSRQKYGARKTDDNHTDLLGKQTDLNSIFQPSDKSILQKRVNVLFQVQRAIEKRFGTGYKVETFGSVGYGAASAASDMDLIVLDQKRRHGFDPQGKKPLPSIYRLNVLADALRDAGFTKVRPIPATVPIVKFKDPRTGIECDINVNDQPGYWNTLMLKRYTTLSPHLGGLLIAIKRWAKSQGLNTPSPTKAGEKVTFSSYAFAVMTVGFLQNRGLLPNLQENIGPDVKDHPFWNRKPKYLCDLRFNWNVPPLPGNDQILTTELFADWFKFWAEFDPTRQMVDIRLWGIIPRVPAQLISLEKVTKEFEASYTAERGPFQPSSDVNEHDAKTLEGWERQPICVIDPFIRVRNVTRNISKLVFEDFQDECRRMGEDLQKK